MVDPLLAFVAVGKVTIIDLGALEVEKLFPYRYAIRKIVVLPVKPLFVRYSASGAKVRKGRHP